MKNKTILILLSFLILGNILYSESLSDKTAIDSFNLRYNQIIEQQKKANRDILLNSRKLKSLESKITFLENNILLLEKENETMQKSLNDKLLISENSIKNQIGEIRIVISNRTLYMLLLIFIVFALIFVISYLLRHKIALERKVVDDKLLRTKQNIDEENLRLDSKLIEIADKQLYVLQNNPIVQGSADGEIDHSLVLMVTDEITRIQMNLANMDESVKGHKQLSRAVTSIIDNLNANGYEILELLNKPFNEGMRLVATMVADENLNPGTQIIKRVVKPQVNYKGKNIQTAQVVVAYNDK